MKAVKKFEPNDIKMENEFYQIEVAIEVAETTHNF